MGAIVLASLPDVLRKAGLDVELFPGYETRSRSTGGYEDVRAIGVHHDGITAGVPEINRSRAGWVSDWNRNRPVGAIRLNKDGTCVVGSLMATNTQGRGGPVDTSKGPIPKDQGNLYTVSIEPSNDGHGEVWPTVQTDAYVTLCAAIMLFCDLTPGDVFAHFEWAPARKADPAGPSRYAQADAEMWDMDRFRADVARRARELIANGQAWGYPDPTPDEGDEVTQEQYEALDAKLEVLLSLARTQAFRQDWVNNQRLPLITDRLAEIHAEVSALADAGATVEPGT